MYTLPFVESLTKTFVFQKQQTQQSTFIEGQVSLNSTLVDISSLLIQNCPPTQFKVCIYDPEANKFVSLLKIKAQNGLVPRHFLEPNIILIRFRKIEQKLQNENLQSSFDLESKNKKDLRSKQRTVRQAIALVKRWRQLTNTTNKPGNSSKRMNLQEAARQIAISKKSLDDYYCQLRLAELHNFNFAQNMDEKMGKLRSYVKDHRTDQSIRIRHHKHPRNLKVIEEFVVDKSMEEYIQREKELRDQQKMKEESIAMQIQHENPFFNQFSQHKIFDNLEDDYYKGFQFILDEPSDPFLCDNRNFNQEMFEDDSQGSLFF